jgi:tetratricopeptide (TPR) repeat protein
MKTGDTKGADPIERLQAGALAHRRPQKNGDCPDEDRLRLLLPGQLEPEEAETLLTHAAECDWCGTVLREATRDLIEPPTDAEEELAGKARLADPRRRRELVNRIVKPRQIGEQSWLSILRWWPAAAFASLVLAGGVSYQQWARSPAHTARLLAKAYTKSRPMEARLRGAEWGPVRTQLGAASSSFNEPVELTDAIGNIKRAIAAQPEDARWLQLRGQADLLEGKEDDSIDELERAAALRSGDSSILADLGAALFEKAEMMDDAQLRIKAFERLSEGVRLNGNDPVLLFNRALAAQSNFDYNEAHDDWAAYLRVDSTSRWAQEARRHLDEVKKNLSGSGPTPPPQPPTH